MPGLVNELVAEVEVRTVSAVTPADMAEWINRYHWNPGPLGGAPFSAGDYATFAAERGAVETFLGMHAGRIVGSLALYPVSALKGGHGAVVWMDSFAVDPEFRLSTLPMRLFVEAFVFCVASGYDRVDCNASPANPSMVAIVRAGGFKRATAQPCGDDRLEFRSYLPLLYRYLIESLGLGDRLVEVAKAWTDHSTSPWVPSPAPPARGAEDIEDFHGAGAFRYGVSGSGVDNSFLIDLEHDRVCALDWSPVAARLYPEGGRDAPPGTEVGFAHQVANTGDRPLAVSLAVGRPNESPLWTDEVTLPPGGTVAGVTSVAVASPGTVEVELTVRTEVLHAGRAHPARLRLHSWVRGRTPAPTQPPAVPVRGVTVRGVTVGGGANCDVRIGGDDREWVVDNRWLRLAVDRVTGTARIQPRHGEGPAVCELWPDLGPPFPAALKTPPARPLHCVTAEMVDGAAVLTLRSPANIWWLRHGPAYRRQGRIGAGLADAVLQRRWTVTADQLVSVDTSVLRAAEQTRREIEAGDHLLRVYPWVRGRSLTMAVPLDTGTLRAPLVYERFPFGMHSLEMPDSLDLPRDPERYAERWSAFTGDGFTAGLLWERADQVRFGLHWMPSLLLAADGTPDGPAFPRYGIYCGPGDERAVRAAWGAALASDAPAAAPARTPLAEAAPVVLRTAPVAHLRDGGLEVHGQIGVLSARARRGVLTAAVAGGPQVPVLEADLPGSATQPFSAVVAGSAAPVRAGLVDTAVDWTESLVCQRERRPVLALPESAKPVDAAAEGDTWALHNGPLRVRVAPDYGAALVSLECDGVELLRSTYPKLRPLGIVAAGRGGINPSLAAHRAEPMGSVAQELFGWTARDAAPAESRVAGATWSGVRLSGTATTSGVPLDLDIEYLLAPGVGALLVRCRVTGGRDGGQPPQWCLAVHVDPQVPWVFRGAREDGEYEYRPSPPGSNRPIGGSRGFGALVGRRQLMLAGAGDTEVLGFRDGDDWSIRSLSTLRPAAGLPPSAAACLAVCDPEAPLRRAAALRDIAQDAAAWPV